MIFHDVVNSIARPGADAGVPNHRHPLRVSVGSLLYLIECPRGFVDGETDSDPLLQLAQQANLAVVNVTRLDHSDAGDRRRTPACQSVGVGYRKHGDDDIVGGHPGREQAITNLYGEVQRGGRCDGRFARRDGLRAGSSA